MIIKIALVSRVGVVGFGASIGFSMSVGGKVLV